MKLDQKLAKLPISSTGDRAPRFQVVGRAALTFQESSMRIECEMRNISRTGVLVLFSGHVQRPLESGESVQLTMEAIPHLFDQPIECRATVARMEKLDSEDQVIWSIGLRFEQSTT